MSLRPEALCAEFTGVLSWNEYQVSHVLPERGRPALPSRTSRGAAGELLLELDVPPELALEELDVLLELAARGRRPSAARARDGDAAGLERCVGVRGVVEGVRRSGRHREARAGVRTRGPALRVLPARGVVVAVHPARDLERERRVLHRRRSPCSRTRSSPSSRGSRRRCCCGCGWSTTRARPPCGRAPPRGRSARRRRRRAWRRCRRGRAPTLGRAGGEFGSGSWLCPLRWRVSTARGSLSKSEARAGTRVSRGIRARGASPARSGGSPRRSPRSARRAYSAITGSASIPRSAARTSPTR